MCGRRPKRKAALAAHDAILRIKKQQQADDDDEQNDINSKNGTTAMIGEQYDSKPVLFCGGSITLPQEILKEILDFLPKKNMVHSASLVCSSWNRATKRPDLWPVLDADIWNKFPAFSSMRQFLLFLRRPQFARLRTLTPPSVYRTVRRNVFDQIARACPLLEEMDLSGTNSMLCNAVVPSGEELPRIPELFPKLKKIQICMRNAQAEQVAEFARGMGERLVGLSVQAGTGRDRVDGRRHDLVDETLETLAEHCPNLERFCYDLASDFFIEERLSERGAIALIRNCAKLKYLRVHLPQASCDALHRLLQEAGGQPGRFELCLMAFVPADESELSDDESMDSSDDELD